MSPVRMAVAARNRRSRPGRGTVLALDEFQGQVIASTDDAHEFTGTGAMDTTREEVAIGHATEDNLEVVTGVRFQNVTLAQGTLVQFARLRFVSRWYNANDLDVTIRAQASDDAPAFTSTNGDISGRALTTASVTWTIPTWEENQDNADTRSPDVASVVQEVINRAGWAPGNALVFIISRVPAANVRRRFFHAYDGVPAKAARVSVNTAEEPAPEPIEPSEYDLVGDPGFTTASLTSPQQAAYADFWTELNDQNNWLGASGIPSVQGQALSDDIFQYARELASHIQCVLLCFRATGDLALLDHIDKITQLMRSKLADGWRGTNDGSDGTTDGYLNWVFRPGIGGTDTHVGKDTRVIDDIGAHANTAAFAYAFEANRHLSAHSPGGVDYAERADFWKDYLVNHFEPKWRGREPQGVPYPQFPFHNAHGQTITGFKWIRWHYFMGKLTGNSIYTDEAVRMSDVWWDHQYEISANGHPAYVYAPGIAALGGPNTHLLGATTYTGSNFPLLVEFHLEGFHKAALHSTMTRYARMFTEFITDTGDWIPSSWARDVGGEVPRLHLSPDLNRNRLERYHYRDRAIGFIAPWDVTGQVSAVNEALQAQYVSTRDTTRLASAIFFNTMFTVETG